MTVYLVGAGPGHPELITVRGQRLIEQADAVVYDRLAGPELVGMAPANAERYDVGKRGPSGSVGQDEINELLVRLGRQFECVIRLKGGDPFVFARGAEEAAALNAAGVDWQVVPGITSAIAAPAYGGIPVTTRYSSTHFTVVTGHEDPTKTDGFVDWRAIAATGGTIVILMGVARWESIARELIAGGIDPATPAAAVRWATRTNQETIRATVATLHEQRLAAPATIVVGAVSGLELDWCQRRPLWGRSIVLTRPGRSNDRLAAALEELGADVRVIPAIDIGPPRDPARLSGSLGRLDSYDWLVVTSAHGAAAVLDGLDDIRQLGSVKVAVVGKGTASRFRAVGLHPDLVAAPSTAAGLIEQFPHADEHLRRSVLWVRGDLAPQVIPEGLSARGWTVDAVDGYSNTQRSIVAERTRITSADVLVLASPSAFVSLIEQLGPDDLPDRLIAIGPTTEAAIAQAGRTSTVAAEPTTPGLVDAVIRSLGAPE